MEPQSPGVGLPHGRCFSARKLVRRRQGCRRGLHIWTKLATSNKRRLSKRATWQVLIDVLTEPLPSRGRGTTPRSIPYFLRLASHQILDQISLFEDESLCNLEGVSGRRRRLRGMRGARKLVGLYPCWELAERVGFRRVTSGLLVHLSAVLLGLLGCAGHVVQRLQLARPCCHAERAHQGHCDRPRTAWIVEARLGPRIP